LSPFKNKVYLVVINATSKWLVVFEVNGVIAGIVISKLQELIARFVISKSITSDGTKCFTGKEFETFCKNAAIQHLLVHLST